MDRETHLLKEVADGNEAAFAELFRIYQPRLASFFLRRTRDRHVSEELSQETLVVVWDRATTFDTKARPSSWIFGIGYRKYLEWHRKSARSQKLFQTEADRDVEGLPHRPGSGVSGKLGQEELMEQVRQALKQLSEEHRMVMELTFQEGLSYEEIAQMLEIKPGTVKSRMFYAKQELKEILINRGMKGDELWKIAQNA
jgi:RNA polymerase sigma-70 factor (ECF subfamily)